MISQRPWWQHAGLVFLASIAVAGFAWSTSHIAAHVPPQQAEFSFALIGDRTGETVPGVYEQVWQDVEAEHPAFVVTVGDTIQGFEDASLNAQWNDAMHLLQPFRKQPIYFVSGNHDVWSPPSAEAYVRYTKRPLHYSFDYEQAHFTILEDHSEVATAPLAASELDFLEHDLTTHAGQRLKFVFSHRPSWLVAAVLKSQDSVYQKLAKQYGVQFFIAGHIHQMLRFNIAGVTYLSLPSAGGHLRASKRYEDGWFFAHTLVTVSGREIKMKIEETGAPVGQSRVTSPAEWGAAGLLRSSQ